ncbi:MAG: hypothetical protein LIO93_09140 [Bacteroidales bacterium]|nr:hypothetical protein [Bacteroidales bacterium]
MLNNATRQFIKKHLSDDIHKLALQSRSLNIQDVDIPFALDQIRLRKKSKYKIPSWYTNDNIIYPSSVSLE